MTKLEIRVEPAKADFLDGYLSVYVGGKQATVLNYEEAEELRWLLANAIETRLRQQEGTPL